MKTVLIVTNRTLHNSPRVIRTIDALQAQFEIYTVGLTPPQQKVKAHFSRSVLRESMANRVIRKINRSLLKRFIPWSFTEPVKLQKTRRLLSRLRPDLVICHDCEDLPYLASLKSTFSYKLIFNAHEYYPLEHNEIEHWENTWQLYFEELYRRFLPEVDLMINVCESIREKCLLEFGHDSLVIPNASAYQDLQPSQVQSPVQLIHHGGAIASRKIEEMIRMMPLLGPAYFLTLMLTPTNPVYFAQLKKLASDMVNVQITEAVPFSEIVGQLNHFDIGVYLLPPDSFNNSVALPNKFFEYIQARLCLAIGPSVEMQRTCTLYQLGVVAPDFTAASLANCIRSLSQNDIQQYKQNANKTAAILSAEHFAGLLLKKIQAMLA